MKSWNHTLQASTVENRPTFSDRPVGDTRNLTIDKTLVNRRFSRVVESYHREAVAQRQIAVHLNNLLLRHAVDGRSDAGDCPFQVRRPHVLEIGCGTGFLTRPLLETLRPERLVLNDLCAEMERCFRDLLQPNADGWPEHAVDRLPEHAVGRLPENSVDRLLERSVDGGLAHAVDGRPRPEETAVSDACDVSFLPGDAESILFPGGQDLIVSCSVVQWFTSPESFFARCRGLLQPDGWLAFSTFGPDNMKEMAAVAGAGLEYRSLEAWKALLEPHFDLVYAGEEHLEMTFSSPLEVLYHLKHTGVTAVRREAWTPGDLRRFCARYTQAYGRDGKVPLTYHPLYFIARPKPHALDCM